MPDMSEFEDGRDGRATMQSTIWDDPRESRYSTGPGGSCGPMGGPVKAPIPRPRRRSSVSRLVKESYDTEKNYDIDQRQLDKRLKSLNADDPSEKTAVEESKYVVDHESRYYFGWVSLMTALGFYSSCVAAYQIAFFDSFTSFDATLVVEWLIDLCFIGDLALCFLVSYNVDDVKILSRHRIRHRLLRKPRFYSDVVACLPLDLVQAATGWTPLCRVNKLLRLWTLAHHTQLIADSSTNLRMRNLLRIGRLIVVWLVTPHMLACIRLLLSRIQVYAFEEGYWKPPPTVRIDVPWTQYLHSLYWCMGLMTGFGDGNVPENVPQYVFTLFVINLGLFTFAYTVGVLGAIGSQGAKEANDFQVVVHSIKAFTSKYELQDSLQERICNYCHHRWETIISGEKELVDAAELLDQLPRTMRYEAVESLTLETLAKVPLFARVEEGFMHALTQKMQAINCSIGETLVRQGEINDSFYIVLNGRLSVHVDGNSVEDLSSGSFFGERTMLSKTAARATVTSLSFCELYRLLKSDLQTLRINFPDTFSGFEQAAKLEAKNADRAAKRNKMSAASGDVGERLPKWLIYPNSRLRALWTALVYLSISYDVILFPVKLVFVGNRINATLTALDVFFDLLLLADTFLQFRLAYTVDGRIVTNPKEIRRRYLYGSRSRAASHQVMSSRVEFSCRALALRGCFLPTLVSSFPASILCPLHLAGADARYLQAFRSLRVLRMIPFLRTDPVTRQQPSGLDELLRLMRHSPYDLMYTAHRLLPLLAAYFVLAHYVACGYWAVVSIIVPPHENDFGIYYVPYEMAVERREAALTAGVHVWTANATIANATLDASGEFFLPWGNTKRVDEIVFMSEWLPTTPYLQNGNVLLWYLRALYFAVCNLTGLGKSPVPFKNLALMYTTVTFIIGVLVFAYITSSIVTLVMNANAPLVRYQANKNSLLGFMGAAHVKPHLVHRASKWMEHWWFTHGGTPAGYVIDKLPPSLREEVRYRVFQKTTMNSRVFQPLWDGMKRKPGGPGRKSGMVGKKNGASSTADEAAADIARQETEKRDLLARELVNAMDFEVYNPGEWVLHKGMLNEFLFIVTVGQAEVLLVEPEKEGGGGPPTAGMRGKNNYSHLGGKAIAVLDVGDCFGEISAMYRNKCEASIRAKTPLELITIPRTVMMKCLHRSNPLMQKVLDLIRRRRKENDYYKLGKTNVQSTAIAMVAAHKLGAWIRKKMDAKKEVRRASAADANAANAAAAAHLAAAGGSRTDTKPDLNA
jgi:CRP-like cAMP-binding protein